MLTGAVVAVKTSNPLLGLVFAFLSHFILDIIPHKDYDIEGDVKKADSWSWLVFWHSAIKIIIDSLLGVLIILFLFKSDWSILLIALAGAFFGILPDITTFLYYRLGVKNGFWRTFQNFHEKIQQWYFNEKIKNQPLVLGILSQVAILILMLWVK